MFDNYDYPINLIVSVFGSYPDNWKVPKDLNETVEFIVKELGIIEGTIDNDIFNHRFKLKEDIKTISSKLQMSTIELNHRLTSILNCFNDESIKTYLLYGKKKGLSIVNKRIEFINHNPEKKLISSTINILFKNNLSITAVSCITLDINFFSGL